jgi:hypothetical protein
MKFLILVFIQLISILSFAGGGGTSGGSSTGSITINELNTLLKSKNYDLQMAQIGFQNQFGELYLTTVNTVCARNLNLETIQAVDVLKPKPSRLNSGDFVFPDIYIQSKLVRSRITDSTENKIIPLEQNINIFKASRQKETFDSQKQFLGTKKYTIPNCN